MNVDCCAISLSLSLFAALAACLCRLLYPHSPAEEASKRAASFAQQVHDKYQSVKVLKADAVHDTKRAFYIRQRASTASLGSRNVSARCLRLLLVLATAAKAAGGCLYTPDANGHVDVPSSVTKLVTSAFYECTSLVSISMENVTSLEWGTFYKYYPSH